MSSGQTLLIFTPQHNEPPSTNFATFGSRNGILTLLFDATTQESAIFRGVLPRNYAGGGITVYVHFSAVSATSGTIGWDVAFERIGAAQQDIDSDGFATAQAITPISVNGTSGNVSVANLDVTNGANMDSIVVGELFRLRLRRDPASDTATGDAEFLALELKET